MPRDSAGNRLAVFTRTLSFRLPFCFGSMATSTYTPSLGCNTGINLSELVPTWAMCSSLLCSLLPRFNSSFMLLRNRYFWASIHNLFHTPAIIDTHDKSVRFYTNFFSKINSLVPSPINYNIASPSLVSLLILFGSPTTISRIVWPVIVNSIKRISCWSRPHIGLKNPKTNPLIAYSNTSSTVIQVGDITWVVTAASHSIPDAINFAFFFKHFNHHKMSWQFNIICPESQQERHYPTR
jgi:hypothetical protein